MYSKRNIGKTGLCCGAAPSSAYSYMPIPKMSIVTACASASYPSPTATAGEDAVTTALASDTGI
ncbi:MAG TPA: hypothetical protein VGB50_12270 [Flavobacterium sp.]